MTTAILSLPVSQPTPVTSLPGRLAIRWHLLSLDAPTVAVVWLLLLNRKMPARELAIEAGALACAVWFIYVLDRFLDAKRKSDRLYPRHLFVDRKGRSFLLAMACVLPFFVLLTVALPSPVRLAWTALSLPLATYAVCVHLLPWRVPKELLVGIFFAIVVTAPSWAGRPWLGTAPAAGMFCVLCWCNCLCIARWEAESPQGFASRGYGLPVLLGIAGVVCLLPSSYTPVVVACAVSGLLLFLLHRQRDRLDPLLLRSLADAALLTPLLVLPFLRRA